MWIGSAKDISISWGVLSIGKYFVRLILNMAFQMTDPFILSIRLMAAYQVDQLELV